MEAGMAKAKMSKHRFTAYREIARLAHEMTCRQRGCNYPERPDMGYLDEHVRVCMRQDKMDQCKCSEKITSVHCQNAVNAENLAAAILRAIQKL
jgi:hypothetical protein